MRKLGYNFQGNNPTANTINGWSQCFATSAIMLLSFYAPKIYRADDDELVKQYVLDITKRSVDDEYEWSCQAKEIQKYLANAGVDKEVKLGIDLNTGIGTVDIETLGLLLDEGPVIIGTKKMAGLPGGHIILGVDHNEEGISCNDPAGDANTLYKSANGQGVMYKVRMFDAKYPLGPIRCMWVK